MQLSRSMSARVCLHMPSASELGIKPKPQRKMEVVLSSPKVVRTPKASLGEVASLFARSRTVPDHILLYSTTVLAAEYRLNC